MDYAHRQVYTTDDINIRALAESFTRATTATVARRAEALDAVRYNRWDGQSDDGRKWKKNQVNGSNVFPWDGASDTRIPLVDEVVRFLSDLCVTSSKSAQLTITGTDTNDAIAVGAAGSLLKWLRSSRLKSLANREAKLLASHVYSYGHALLYVGWRAEQAIRNLAVDAEALVRASEAVGLDPQSTIQLLEGAAVEGGSPTAVADLIEMVFQTEERSTAVEAAEAILAGGVAQVPISTVAVNEPTLEALEPWADFVISEYVTDIQSAPEIFVRRFYNEVQLRALATAEGWDEEWVEAAVKTAGKRYHPQDERTNVIEEGSRDASLDEDTIEVIFAYRKLLNKAGAIGVYCTIFSPLAQLDEAAEAELYAKHYLLDYAHNLYPFVAFRSESTDRRLQQSRGVGDVASTWQSEVKVQRDSIADRTSLETVPTLLVNRRLGQLNKIGPAVQVGVARPDDVTALPINSPQPRLAIELIRHIERQTNRYYGVPDPEVVPQLSSVRQQSIVDDWLTQWAEVWRQAFILCTQFMDPQEVQRITGVAIELTPEMGRFDFILEHDVRNNDTEFLTKKLEAIAQIMVNLDVGGALDRNALVSLIARLLVPEAADQLIVNPNTASEQLLNEVKQNLVGIAVGVEPSYRQEDPAAGTKLQFTQGILEQAPQLQSLIAQSQSSKELLEKYIQSLQFQVQQQQNAQIGRIGVQPAQQ